MLGNSLSAKEKAMQSVVVVRRYLSSGREKERIEYYFENTRNRSEADGWSWYRDKVTLAVQALNFEVVTLM